MTLADVLKITGMENETDCIIMYRITIFQENTPLEELDDMHYGYCRWNGKCLEPLDGDFYSLDDEIIRYKISETECGEEVLSVTVEGAPLFNLDDTVGIDDYADTVPEDGNEHQRTRAERRYKDYTKALRKQKIAHDIYAAGGPNDAGYYDNLHQYSKGKIHCSCPMCRAKTNAKLDKGHGGRYGSTSWGSTAHRMGKNYKPSEQVKIADLEEKEREYLEGETV